MNQKFKATATGEHTSNKLADLEQEALSPQPTGSSYFNPAKTEAPEYNDFLNNVFAAKRHQAYARHER